PHDRRWRNGRDPQRQSVRQKPGAPERPPEDLVPRPPGNPLRNARGNRLNVPKRASRLVEKAAQLHATRLGLYAGTMFVFNLNTLSGSYFRLISRNRS